MYFLIIATNILFKLKKQNGIPYLAALHYLFNVYICQQVIYLIISQYNFAMVTKGLLPIRDKYNIKQLTITLTSSYAINQQNDVTRK